MAPVKKRPPPKTFSNEASSSKRRNHSHNDASLQQGNNLFRCGKIIRMHLTNFMCHSNLVINFSDRVNFLVGNNGSGKSAILAALVLGLGAKASSTNRSQNMQKFIKTEESFTNIEIEIANSGIDAFNYETYGDKIIIVRHITQKTSFYRIKNAEGIVVSKKAEDLHKIMLYHNIQVENPVFVLNQENARVFLKDLDPTKNYELFIKATQIEMVGEKLNDCLRASKLQTLQLNCLGQTISQAKEEIDELKEKLAELDSIERVKKLINKCELERLWIFVIEQEKQIQAVNISMEELITQKMEFENLLQNKETFERDSGNALREIQIQLEEKRSLYSQENIKFNSLKTAMVQTNDRSSEIHSFIEGLTKKHTFVKTQIDKLQEYIAQKASNNLMSVQDLRAKHENELSSLRHQREEVAAILERTKHDAQILIGNMGQIDQKIDDLKKNKRRLQEEAGNIQSQIHNLNANSKDALSIYGEHVSRIVSTINRLYQERQFSEMPRGPLGRYIEVVDARFRDAVENQLGGLVNSFVVSNNKDYKILENVLKKYPNFNPTIITTKFMNKVYDVSKGKVRPPNGTKLLMDQIRCSDNVVLNCLIDRGSIESILLTESKDVAEKFTAHIANVPENLKKIILSAPGLEYCPEPSYRMYSLKIRPARFIQVDIRERIFQMEVEIKSNKEEISHCEAMLLDLTPQLQQIAQSIKRNRSLVENHEHSERGLCERINELESFEYPDSNEMDLLANELQECKTKLSQIEKLLEEKTKEASDTKIGLRELKENLTDQKVSLKSIENEMNQMKIKSDDIRVNLTSSLNNLRVNEAKLQEIDSAIQRLEEDKKSKIQALGELRIEAEKRGSRIDSEKSELDINEIIQKLKSKIKHRTRSNDSNEDLQMLIESKSQSLTKNEELFSSVKETLEMLNESRIKRFRFIKHLKRHMAMKVMFTFQGILSYRQFTGDISIDHDERKLTLSVFPRDHGLEGLISSTKALSGGERSFSTVAFLLSLWSCVDHPFYLLDEYDVFTDEVNREVMTLMLLNEAEAKPQRQYTFLSPQDMALESKDYIRIHRKSGLDDGGVEAAGFSLKQRNHTRSVLATGYIRLQNERGDERFLRALFDTGSEVNLITEKAVRTLNLKKEKFSVEINGISGRNWCDGGLVQANIKPWFSMEDERINDMILYFIVIKSIPQPKYFVNERRVEDFEHLVLADPNYNKATPVDLLLGVSICSNNGLIAQSSAFGFIIYGSVSWQESNQKSFTNFMTMSEDKLETIDQLIRRFWELRDYSAKKLSLLEEKAELQFAGSVERNNDGRFIVRIPWSDENRELGDSRLTALNRLKQLERRLAIDPELRQRYNDFMRKYINLGHMREAKEDEIAGGYYIPHHAVIKKFRVVFDASCITSNGKSLNDIQLAGANLQEHLDVIIMRFRFHRFVLATDVRKMFRQFLIHQEDVKYQKIVWRFDDQETPKVYVLLTVTYGQKSSPFLAIRTMRELATRYQVEYPLASKATLFERYMDDYFTGTDNIEQAKILYKELSDMLGQAGLELSKWRSNCEELLQFIREDVTEVNALVDLNDEYTAVLEWSDDIKITKRVVASEVAKLYDPNGYLAPVVVTAKCFIQRLWQRKLEWDEELPPELEEEWRGFFTQLEALNSVQIPRWLQTSGGRAFELVGFADASQKAYGGVIYVRVIDGVNIHSHLLTSRSRVAPVKTVSIPRLELCAAETLATLMEQVRKDCHIEYANYYCFTDSMITLNWIKTESVMFKTFVSNRVASIQRSTDVRHWRHVPTKNNPADLLSRGLRAKELPLNELWWQGPEFLKQTHQDWPLYECDLEDNQRVQIQSEFKPSVCARTTVKSICGLQINGQYLIERYSSLNKLVRVTACVFSCFRHRRKETELRSIGYSNDLLNEALEYWIKFTQLSVFSSEINALKEGKALCKSSSLIRLNPFLDERSLLRLRGRIENASVSYDEQHPIIIPAHTGFVRLIMQEAHEKTQHGHTQLMLHYVRAKYWIIQSRRAALKAIKSCVVCLRHAHQERTQLMADLPKERLSIAPAFTYCGVDYFGPISLHKWEGRCNTTIVGYVAIFVCMTTKLVHMECCTDLTAERFLWALSRMSALYRTPVKMFSDNGRTFIGANNELKRISQS